MPGDNLLVASSITPKVLVSAQLGTADAAVYTVAAAQSVKLATGSLCNTTASAVTVYVSLVQSGGAVDATHRIISGFSLAANDTQSLTGYIDGAMLGPGDVVAAYAGTATAVAMVLTGTVHS